MGSTGRKAAGRRASSGRKNTGKTGVEKAGGAASSRKAPAQPISSELQAQLDATQELNPAARGGRKT